MTRKKPARRIIIKARLYFVVSCYGVTAHGSLEEALRFQADIKSPTRIFKGLEFIPTKERKGDE